MITVKIRITADNEADATQAREYLKALLGEGLTLAKPRQGTNPKYADNQTYMCYGEYDFTPGISQLSMPVVPTRRRTRKPKA
jgi:hypothetical protein